MPRIVQFIALVLTAAVVVSQAIAQSPWPTRPIRLIVPTPPGGSSDAAARLLAQALTKSLGQQVLVENRSGASGALGAQALMAAPPDGYTLLWTLSSMSGLPSVLKSPPYQSLAELTPVAIVGHLEYAMFVHTDIPGRTVSDFVDYARANPDRISYATGSLGDYMATTRFFKATSIRGVRVPYKGGSQLMPDLVSGRVQLNFGPVSSGLQHVKDGKLRMLAVLLPRRSAVVPEVPTLAETGMPAVSLSTWQAIFAPPNTPGAIAERLSREIATAVGNTALRAQLEQLAIQVEGSTPQRLAALAAQDTETWRIFVREYDIPQE